MTIEKGSAFLLKIGDGAPTPNYTTIAGMRATTITINAEQVNITNKGSGGWRELLAGAGIRTVTLTGSGIFTNSAAETRARNNALAGLIDDYVVTFENSDTLRGKFLMTRLDYGGDFNGERTYTLTLESTGAVSFAP